jgi:hypothetical protein
MLPKEYIRLQTYMMERLLERISLSPYRILLSSKAASLSDRWWALSIVQLWIWIRRLRICRLAANLLLGKIVSINVDDGVIFEIAIWVKVLT